MGFRKQDCLFIVYSELNHVLSYLPIHFFGRLFLEMIFYLDPLLNSTSGFNGHMSGPRGPWVPWGPWGVNVNEPGLSERYFLDVMRKGEVKVVIRYSNEPQVFLS